MIDSKIAVIVDTKLESFDDVVENHFRFLDTSWQLMIFTDDPSKISFSCRRAMISPINSIAEYNNLLTSITFWNAIPREHVLIFQHDSELLKEGIDDFLEWDYVGAPWVWQKRKRGGNGGLSIRSKSAMIKTIERLLYNPSTDGNEDTYFSKFLVGKMAPQKICRSFSCETIFELNTIGCHAIDNYLSPGQCGMIRNFSGINT